METSELLSIFLQHKRVATDTRKIQAGDLFFALKGANFDANTFAAQALEMGAAYVVLDNADYAQAGDNRYILVKNVLQSLQDLARAYRRTFSIPFIGITGSNGKTTSKELLYSVLATEKKAYATAGNFNNHLGVPLTLLAMPEDTEIAIIEMGANQPDDIQELCQIAEPTHGVITNVGFAHLEKLINIEGVRTVKGQLFEWLRDHQGFGFVNIADENVKNRGEMLSQKWTYGTASADFSCKILQNSMEGLKIEVARANHSSLLLTSTMSGDYNAMNMLMAASVATYFGISDAGIQKGIAQYIPENSRSQIIQKGKFTLWMDAYNANPSSMKAAISHIFQANLDKKVAVILGDMREMGAESPKVHETVGRQIADLPSVATILVGPEMQEYAAPVAGNNVFAYTQTSEALPHIAAHLQNAEVVLIKGSRGIALEKLLEGIGE